MSIVLEPTGTITWDDLHPPCDYTDFPGCTEIARWIALAKDCPFCNAKKTNKLVCDGHKNREFYCTSCMAQYPVEMMSL